MATFRWKAREDEVCLLGAGQSGECVTSRPGPASYGADQRLSARTVGRGVGWWLVKKVHVLGLRVEGIMDSQMSKASMGTVMESGGRQEPE